MNTKKFIRLFVLFILIMVFAAACASSSPADVAKKAISYQIQGKCEELPQFFTSKFISNSGGESEAISQCRDVYNAQSKNDNEMKSIKVIETVSENDDAMVILQIQWKEGQTSTMSVMLERENNQWRIWSIF